MSLWIVLIPGAAVAALVGLSALRSRFLVVRVAGASMLPNLRPGDCLFVRRGTGGRLRVGMVIIVRPHPRDREAGSGAASTGPVEPALWVKRVAALPGDPVPDAVRAACGDAAVVPAGMTVLLADNPAGYDSRQWGFVSIGQTVGHAVTRLSPRRRLAAGDFEFR